MNKASFGQRFAAWIIDQIILAIVGFLLIFLFSLVGGQVVNTTGDAATAINSLLGFGLYIVLVVLQFVYFGYYWSSRGRSIGMGMMNIKVVRRDNSYLPFLIAGLRGTIGYYISGLVFGLGYLWFFVDEQRETWHDKIFGTEVVKG